MKTYQLFILTQTFDFQTFEQNLSAAHVTWCLSGR